MVVKEGVADWVTTGRYSCAYHLYMYYIYIYIFMIAHDMYTRYIKFQAYKWDYPFKNCMRQIGLMKKNMPR